MITTVPKYENRKTYAGRREMSGGTDFSVCLDFSRVSKHHTGAGAIGTPDNKIIAGPPLVPNPSTQVWRDVAASGLRLRNIEKRQFEIASLFRMQYLVGKFEFVILRV